MSTLYKKQHHFLKKYVFAFMITGMCSQFAYAQTTTSTTIGVTTSQPKKATLSRVILADVNIVKITPTSTNNSFSGTFLLQSKLGDQNNIVYGISVFNDVGEIVDIKALGSIPFLKEGEIKEYSYSYALPKTVSGKIRVLLTVQTQSGLNLTLSPLYAGIISGHKTVPFCKYEEIGNRRAVGCSSLNKRDLVADFIKGSIFNSSTDVEKFTLEEGKKITLTLPPSLAPGNYFAIITDTKSGEKEVFQIYKDGTYGIISSISLYAGKIEGQLKGVILTEASTSTVVSLDLKDVGNISCGSYTGEIKGRLLQLNMQTTCKEGRALVTLKDKQGVVLSSSSQNFSGVLFSPEETIPEIITDFFKANIVTMIALVSLLIGLIVLLCRRSAHLCRRAA